MRECRLELTLEPEAFALVDAGELLHLDVAARGPGAAGFAPTAEVRIEARLADDLRGAGAGRVHRSAGCRRAARRAVGAGADSPLLSTESWFALTVTSEVDLPPELAAVGSLREGYSTRWATDEPDPPPS